jgi:hypothetical protein
MLLIVVDVYVFFNDPRYGGSNPSKGFWPQCIVGWNCPQAKIPTNPVHASGGVCSMKLNDPVFHNTKLRKTISKIRSGGGN